MNLRNYGLDSIRICFAMNVFNSQKSYYELDELKQLHERLKRQYEFETLWFNKNLDRPTWNKDNTFWNRNLQCLMYTFKLNDISIVSSDKMTTFDFSVSKFMTGSNIDGNPLCDFNKVILKLNDFVNRNKLEDDINILGATVQRLDINFNFSSLVQQSILHGYIHSRKKSYLKNTTETTLYFKCASHQTCIYSQIDRYRDSSNRDYENAKQILSAYDAYDLIRIEFKLEKNLLNLMKLKVKDLTDCTKLIAIYDKIKYIVSILHFSDQPCDEDLTTFNFNLPEKTKKVDFLKLAIAFLIFNQGYDVVSNWIESKRNIFATDYHYKQSKKFYQNANNLLRNSDSSCEKISQIPEFINNAIDKEIENLKQNLSNNIKKDIFDQGYFI